jgi:hypothetical protein
MISPQPPNVFSVLLRSLRRHALFTHDDVLYRSHLELASFTTSFRALVRVGDYSAMWLAFYCRLAIWRLRAY